MYILGISAFYHDSAVALVKDGRIIYAAQEERFSRKKHDHRFPEKALENCLLYTKIKPEDISLVAFYDKPFLKFERLLETYLMYAPAGIRSFIKAMPLWMKEKLWMKDLIAKKLNYSGKIIFPEHHVSHAASAFFPSPFEEAAILTIDGVGEWATTTYGIGKGNDIELHAEIRFPHSLGLLYSAFTYHTGFRVNSGEYKLMGLAPYGNPVYKEKIYKHLIDVKEDGSFSMNMRYFDYCAGLTMTNKRFSDLFDGPPREPESQITQREMDLARSVQDVTEEIVLKMVRYIRKETGQKNLVLAGGVALNCVANGKILQEKIFDNIWIQPAAGDAGGALGAALAGYYLYQKNERTITGSSDSQSGSYLGSHFTGSEIEAFLAAHSIPFQKLSDGEVIEKTADFIADEKVVGWFTGRMEFGPRALGGRSILGDARSPKMQSVMNLKIKFRESFRPFAPSVLREKTAEWFEMDYDSPYMLLVADVKKEKQKEISEEQQNLFGIDLVNQVRSEIPAVTHVDYSARIQTVHKETNPRYYALIEAFYRKTGCPVIINTSFNVRGEPIVCTPEDAYRCFMRTKMDYLVLENYVIDKSLQPEPKEGSGWMKEYQLD